MSCSQRLLNYLALSVPDEGFVINTSRALSLISTFFINKVYYCS